MNWIERIKHYKDGLDIVRDWWGDGLHPISWEDAQVRANICLAGAPDGKPCPMNLAHWTFAKPIAAAIRKTMEIKKGLALRVRGEKSLGACGICGCSLRLKVWCDGKYLKDELTVEKLQAYPEYCWMKQLETR